MLHVFLQETIKNSGTGKRKGESNLRPRNGDNGSVVVYCVKGRNANCEGKYITERPRQSICRAVITN